MAPKRKGATGFSANGQVYCLTGFRDKDLESKINEAGGKVASSMTKAVTVVVCKTGGEGTKKVQDAADRGLKVMTKEALETDIEGVQNEAPERLEKPPTKKAKSAAVSTAVKKIRLTCTEGTSNKFWEISVSGSTTITTYGKIGTNGSSSTKEHKDAATALKFVEKESAGKIKKGYVQEDDSEEDAEQSLVKTNTKTQKELNESLWEAVKTGDLAAAKAAHSQGACAELFYDGESIMPFKEYIDRGNFEDHGDRIYNGNCEPHEVSNAITTLMAATQSNALPVMSWLLDIGCDVNAAQPENYVYGDGYSFGGLTAIACATSVEAVQLLLSRGANADASHTPPQYETKLANRSTLIEHLELRTEPDRSAIARILIQHGADANDVGFPCHGCGQDEGRMFQLENAPTSYWPLVVASGDVTWAKELLEKYDADPNFPCSVEGVNYGLGASVLQMAILKQDKEMVQLLLDHDAYVNEPEQVWVDWEEFENCGKEDIEDIYFLNEEQLTRYWGQSDLSDKPGNEVPDEFACNLATPLSVALGTGNTEIIQLLKDHGAEAADENAKVPVTFDWK